MRRYKKTIILIHGFLGWGTEELCEIGMKLDDEISRRKITNNKGVI